MRLPRTLILSLAFSLLGCGTLTPVQQANLQTDERGVAALLKLAAPFVPNPAIAAAMDGLALVATAYGNAPVPSSIATATVTTPAISTATAVKLAAVVAPLVSGNNNSAKVVSVINGAAAILASSAGSP